MTAKKTAKELFSELPYPYNMQAIQNTKALNLLDKYDTISHALMTSFVWINTDQGVEYWEELHIKLIKEGK